MKPEEILTLEEFDLIYDLYEKESSSNAGQFSIYSSVLKSLKENNFIFIASVRVQNKKSFKKFKRFKNTILRGILGSDGILQFTLEVVNR